MAGDGGMGKAADEAFQRARERIAQAERECWEKLELTAPEFADLEELPEEITNLGPTTPLSPKRVLRSDTLALADLPGIASLSLRGTKIRDVLALSGLTGLTRLDISQTEVADVSVLSQLTKLTWLNLSNTRVNDLSAISVLKDLTLLDLQYLPLIEVWALAGLKRLRHLDLNYTDVRDLTGLSDMRELRFLDLSHTLVDRHQLVAALTGKPGLVPYESINVLAGPFGVRFAGCAATKSDPELARIAMVTDDRERTMRLLENLGVEVVQGSEPLPDPLLPSLIDEGRLEIPASFPSPDEQDERLKRALHYRLGPKAAECAQKAGNKFPRMGGKARVLAALLDRPFGELDLLSVHLEIEDIEARVKLGSEDEVPYDPDLLAAVGDITRLGPGLTRGNADVELFIRRYQDTREAPVNSDTEATRELFSDAIIAAPDAHGPRSRALETQLKESIDPNVARTLREPKHRNLLVRLGSIAALAVSKVSKDLASDTAVGLIKYALGPGITAFVVNNWTLVTEVAATYGVGFASWIAGTVGLLVMGKGLKDERDKRRRQERNEE